MKLYKSRQLKNIIRDDLTKNCAGRCLDDEDDFEAVMEIIGDAVDEWLDGRCEGCK